MPRITVHVGVCVIDAQINPYVGVIRTEVDNIPLVLEETGYRSLSPPKTNLYSHSFRFGFGLFHKKLKVVLQPRGENISLSNGISFNSS